MGRKSPLGYVLLIAPWKAMTMMTMMHVIFWPMETYENHRSMQTELSDVPCLLQKGSDRNSCSANAQRYIYIDKRSLWII